MLASLPEEQRTQLLQSVGIPPEQLAQISALMSAGVMPGGSGAPTPGGEGGGGQQGGRQQVRVQLTPDEEAQLDQLVQMGFEKMYALQVYLAVGKNVEMAASILFEGGMEMDESGGGSGGGFADGNEGDEGDDDDEDEQMY